MAIFQITFGESARIPSYEDYTKIENNTSCGADNIIRKIDFNTTLQDFSVGTNYSGDMAQSLVIVSYTDEMKEYSVETGLIGVPSTFTPSVIKDNLGTPLTYPYSLNIENLDILQFVSSQEMICDNTSSKFYTERTRTITYYIIDMNGVQGPIRESKIFQTTQ